MFCENCGKKLEDNAKFCPYCGNNLNATKDVDMPIESPIFMGEKTEKVHKKPEEHRLIRKRSIWKFLLLSLVTCGIYSIYAMYTFTEDINSLCEGDGKESPNYIIVLLLGVCTLGIYGFYWSYRQAERLKEAALRYGLEIRESGSTILCWQIFGSLLFGLGPFVATYIMFDNMNYIALVYNEEKSVEEVRAMGTPHEKLVRNVLCIAGGILGVLLLLIVLIVGSMAILLSDSGEDEYQQIERQVKEKNTERTFSDMDFSEFIGVSEEKIKEIGLQESVDFPGYYSALNDSIIVMCEGGVVNTIEISGNTKNTPSFHGVRIGMEEEKGYQIMRESYSEETPGLFVNQESKEMVRCEAENGKISKITYIAMDGELLGEYQDTQEMEGSPDVQEDLSEYIFPDSDKRYLTEDEVRRVELDDLFIGRNEIFARHGYIFNDADLQQYFEATSWYQGTVTTEQFNSDVVFNDFEKKNVQLIKKVEDEINGLVQGDPEQQAVIDDVYSFLIGNTFHLKDTQMLLQFTSENEVVALGYYGTDPQINRYCTYSVSARYEVYKDDIYEYMVYITIDGVEYYMRYFTDGSMDLTGDGEFQGWYER